MTANLNISIFGEYVELLRDTWAECEAFRAKRASEASGLSVDWERCLQAARAEAVELFEPLLVGIHSGASLPKLAQELLAAIRAAESAPEKHTLAQLSRG